MIQHIWWWTSALMAVTWFLDKPIWLIVGQHMGKDQDSTLVTAEPIKNIERALNFPLSWPSRAGTCRFCSKKKGLKLYFCRYFFPGLITKGYLIAETCRNPTNYHETHERSIPTSPWGGWWIEKLGCFSSSIIQPSEPLLQAYMAFLFFSLDFFERAHGWIPHMALSENVVYPCQPNGFADHYPVFKWLFHWGYTLFSDKPTWIWSKDWRNCHDNLHMKTWMRTLWDTW